MRARRDAARALRTLTGYYHGLSRNDPRVCTTYLDPHYLQTQIHLRGHAAALACERQIAGSRTPISLHRIEGIRLAGRYAFIQFTARLGRTDIRRVFRLQYIHGRYRIDAALAAPAAHHHARTKR